MSVTICCVTPTAVLTPFPSILTCSEQSTPAASSLMARSKAKAKKQKQKANSERDGLATNEYYVGTLLDAAAPLERVQMLNASLERILQAKAVAVRKNAVHWVSALCTGFRILRSLTLLRPQKYFVKVRPSAQPHSSSP